MVIAQPLRTAPFLPTSEALTGYVMQEGRFARFEGLVYDTMLACARAERESQGVSVGPQVSSTRALRAMAPEVFADVARFVGTSGHGLPRIAHHPSFSLGTGAALGLPIAGAYLLSQGSGFSTPDLFGAYSLAALGGAFMTYVGTYGGGGSFVPWLNTVLVGTHPESQTRRVLAHELTHAIQHDVWPAAIWGCRAFAEGCASGVERHFCATDTVFAGALKLASLRREAGAYKYLYRVLCERFGGVPSPDIVRVGSFITEVQGFPEALGAAAFRLAEDEYGLDLYRRIFAGDFSPFQSSVEVFTQTSTMAAQTDKSAPTRNAAGMP